MEKGENSMCVYVDISGKISGEIYIIELWCDGVSQNFKSFRQKKKK